MGISVQRCGRAEEMTASCCMCDPPEMAHSLGDDTHAVMTLPKWHESTDFTLVWSTVSVECWNVPSTSARDKDAGKRARKTLTLVNRRPTTRPDE